MKISLDRTEYVEKKLGKLNGDKVFDIRYGWGIVTFVNILTNDWPVEVLFDGEEELLDECFVD